MIPSKDKLIGTNGLKIAPFRKHIRKTIAHRHHNYFEIIYLSKGSGSHTIDHSTYLIDAPLLFFMRRDQIHCWDITSEPEGYVILVKNNYIDEHLELRKYMLQLSRATCLPATDPTIDIYFKLLLSEYQKEDVSQTALVSALFKSFLIKSVGLIDANSTSVPYSGLFQHFIQLLENSRPIVNQVAHYAERLHTSPQNLSQICRKQAGVSASEVIAEYIISEAKRLLDYTSYSVAQVAYELNFKDPSHFTKYFKRRAQVTPQDYRRILLDSPD
ncbi:helix-turn-helix transcriptional regulator [Reichenbachiella carrageenanivorans]|uniref:Helix-turn-helix transcriptional regulator n=1 Tax=Reichenbachiella carrageenanivorans TaxID=2979869 RepID=A0ABY6CZY2_9BACT|nr:helix-turn-helix transcriptional regulator [Reichenbachiella carrageenanivorans]UXX79462.1 helix-turn-helix transcriptional regulator [Reichenbachiella carrageenanivorans]